MEKSEEDGERAPSLIYRRGVSVIISPSLSGSRRASCILFLSLSASLFLFLSFSFCRSICTLPATVIAVALARAQGISPHPSRRSRSLRGTLEWPRRLSALSAHLIHHSTSSIVSANFPHPGGQRGGPSGTVRSSMTTSDFPRCLRFASVPTAHRYPGSLPGALRSSSGSGRTNHRR